MQEKNWDNQIMQFHFCPRTPQERPYSLESTMHLEEEESLMPQEEYSSEYKTLTLFLFFSWLKPIYIYITKSSYFWGCVWLQINRLSMDIQVDYYNITRKEIDSLLGTTKAKQFLAKSIFSVTVGSNDFLNNYMLPVLSIGARITETPDAFIDDMISHLRNQLTVRKRDKFCFLLKTGHIIIEVVEFCCKNLNFGNDPWVNRVQSV